MSTSNANYHHGNLRAALIEAGLEWLETTQNPEFSLRELTRQVGVSVNAAYRHFANKEALLAAMAVEGFHQLIGAQAEAMKTGKSPDAGFMKAGRAYVNFACSHPALFRLMYGRFAVTNPDPELRESVELAYNSLLYSMASVLDLPADDPAVQFAAVRAWSIVHGLSQLIIDGQVAAHTEDIDALVEGVFQPAELGKLLQRK